MPGEGMAEFLLTLPHHPIGRRLNHWLETIRPARSYYRNFSIANQGVNVATILRTGRTGLKSTFGGANAAGKFLPRLNGGGGWGR
jgi:hypothetical protein